MNESLTPRNPEPLSSIATACFLLHAGTLFFYHTHMPKESLKNVPFDDTLLERCVFLAERIRAAGGRALLVGGCVRDAILTIPPKDIDIEVFGLNAKTLEKLIGEHCAVNLVGKSFGVLKLKGWDIDVSLPRRERKDGTGHRGFHVDSDPKMSYAEAASRRDFTLNAISWDPLSGELIDPYHGQSDLINGILRHTSERFGEDPLRVLRGMQFIARFRLRAVPETLARCRKMTTEGIAPERFFDEWQKLLTRGVAISQGLDFLRETGWLRYYPELEALVGCEQDPHWHPEGDVWTHTSLAMDAFARERSGDLWEDTVVGLGVLCHDMGKPQTSYVDEDGRIRSPRHDQVGVAIARAFLERITRHQALIEAVLPLVREHMQPLGLYRNGASDAAIRRLALRVGRIDRLVRIDSADRGGRGEVFTEPSPQGAWLMECARRLTVEAQAPRPILQGRHLIEAGLKPGAHFKKILEAAFEAQTEGAFEDEDGARLWRDAFLSCQAGE